MKAEPCGCPACRHDRGGSRALYIPVGVELLEEMEAHPERAAQFRREAPRNAEGPAVAGP